MAQSKIDGLRRGDLARVTLEGVVMLDPYSHGGITISVDGKPCGFSPGVVRGENFSIEKVSPPIAVGDIVEWTEDRGQRIQADRRGVWKATVNGYAVVAGTHQALPVVVDVRLLRHG